MLQLGVVTYNIARDWDLDAILDRLDTLGYLGVELRTGHKHGVEVTLDDRQRREVRKKFADSPVELAGLGSAFEYHSNDPAEVRRNIEGTKAYVRLAHDVGSPGVKVRPNGVPKGEDPEVAYRRMGEGLREVGEDARDYGVEVRVEVHGPVTSLVPNLARIIAHADHPNVFVCWNSNPTDVIDGSDPREFRPRLRNKIREVHLRDLTDSSPTRGPSFSAFWKVIGITTGYTLAEIGESADPMRVLAYFRSLWQAYTMRAKEIRATK